MWSIGNCLNNYPVPRNSCRLCNNPSCCASLVLLPTCARLKVRPLAFFWGRNLCACSLSSCSTAARAEARVLQQRAVCSHAPSSWLRLGARTLHLCICHLPMCKVATCLGTLSELRWEGGCSRTNGLTTLFSLVQNCWVKKSVLKSSPKGSSADICDMFICAGYKLDLVPRYTNSWVPGGTAIQCRDATTSRTAWLGCWEQSGCSGTKLQS